MLILFLGLFGCVKRATPKVYMRPYGRAGMWKQGQALLLLILDSAYPAGCHFAKNEHFRNKNNTYTGREGARREAAAQRAKRTEKPPAGHPKIDAKRQST